MFYMDIADIVPYEWNPRDNGKAVQSVANSIRSTQGMAQPVLIDSNNVLVAGHTRVEACKLLGLQEIPVVRLDHLDAETINAFRIIDNKVAEGADWNHELLAGEIAKLEAYGIAWTDFGFSQDEIDCLGQLVAADCLSVETLAPVAQQAAQEAAATLRAPRQARVVIGEHVFYLAMEDYRRWSDGISALCNFNKDDIAAEIQRRLRMM